MHGIKKFAVYYSEKFTVAEERYPSNDYKEGMIHINILPFSNELV